MTYELQLVADAKAQYRVAAERFVRHARAAVQQHGRFTVALCGGSTPQAMYALPRDGELVWLVDEAASRLLKRPRQQLQKVGS
jgi:hypothetical protein